jgi:ribonuclease T
MTILPPITMANRFRGFLPIVVDLETAGLNPTTDAILEIAAITLDLTEEGVIIPKDRYFYHVLPFKGANINPASLKFLEISDISMLDHPFRFALPEEQVLTELFKIIRAKAKQDGCGRAVLVGHNPMFDLEFIKSAVDRHQLKSPFHGFTTFDTACLSAVALGETVLAKAALKAGITFDTKEAHSALYDAEKTAELFCKIVNQACWSLP